jgi:amidase
MAADMATVPLTAGEIAASVRTKSVSAVEITRACLERIESVDPKLHAFQLVRAEKALAEAAEIDRRGDIGQLPLAGVPVSIKDNFDVAGEPTRQGSAATSATPAQSDDEAVRRLRVAGAVVIGKTTMPELAIYGFTESAAFGITRNPWNAACSPGGSSGGAAVSVATGMAALALATDGLGSIRIPSTFCGVFGLKPTRGRLPLMRDLTEHWYGLSVSGPIAATVKDAALMFDVLGDTTDFRDVSVSPKALRIALSTKSPTFLARPAPAVNNAVRASAAALRDSGHSVTEADPPYPLTLPNHVLRLWMAGVAQDAEKLEWNWLEFRTKTMARLGKRIGAGSTNVLRVWAHKATRWFESFDVALIPSVARTSIPAGGWSGRGLMSTTLSNVRALPFAAPWNAAGFPAASVPAGIGPEGVPLSVQVVAPARNEALVLSVAALLEQLRPWQRLSALQQGRTGRGQ